MTILLDTPLVVPARGGVPEQTYNEIAIRACLVDPISQQLCITPEYGNTVGGVWVGDGSLAPAVMIENRGPHEGPGGPVADDPAWDDLISGSLIAAGDVGEPTHELWMTQLYDELISRHPEYAGTVSPG